MLKCLHMEKPTLAYIDHIAHKENGSNLFLKEVLSKYFSVTSLWVNPWGMPRVIAPEEINKYDYVLFFQRINQFTELKQVKAKIIWVAVYDSLNTDYFFWKALSTLPIKILSFNKKVNEKAAKFGIKNEYFKFYPDPESLNECAPRNEKTNVLFWYRGTVKWKEVRSVLDPDEIDSLTYRSAPDRHFEPETISNEDIQKYKIRFDNRAFSAKNVLKEMFTENTVFIEPRRMEGIGLAYLEALASGHCVIANNDATMNEYITSGTNGIIVDFDKPQKISLKNWKALATNARESFVKGRKEWLASEEKLVEFAKQEASSRITSSLSVAVWRTLYAIKYFIYTKKQDSVRRAKIKEKKKLAPPVG